MEWKSHTKSFSQNYVYASISIMGYSSSLSLKLCVNLILLLSRIKNCFVIESSFLQLENRNGVGLPVMVFIHGGGFTVGGANIYPPYAMLDADVVLVVVQYRLGVLGE